MTGEPGDTQDTPARPRYLWGPLSMLGWMVAVITLAADQLNKWWMIYVYKLPEKGTVHVTSFLDLVMVWNKGISYGLFASDTRLGQMALIAFALIAVGALSAWLARTGLRLTAVSVGLVIGGALGNAIDRAVYGAVADFYSLHAYGYYWYVFNLADAAIVAGVIGLLYEGLFSGHKKVSKA